MPSMSECRQPYLLSNLLLVTESLTLIAGEQQRAGPRHLVQAMHAGRRLLGDAADAGRQRLEVEGTVSEDVAQLAEDDLPLLRVARLCLGHGAGAEVLEALVDEQRRVAAVVEDHVRLLVAPVEDLAGAPPVLLQRLALPREDRNTGRCVGGAGLADDDRGGRLVLRGEDVARRPAHLRAELDERLDEDCRLDRHVEGAGDPRALEGLRRSVPLPHRHEAGHLVLSQLDLEAPCGGKRDVSDLVRDGRREGVVSRLEQISHAADHTWRAILTADSFPPETHVVSRCAQPRRHTAYSTSQPL